MFLLKPCATFCVFLLGAGISHADSASMAAQIAGAEQAINQSIAQTRQNLQQSHQSQQAALVQHPAAQNSYRVPPHPISAPAQDAQTRHSGGPDAPIRHGQGMNSANLSNAERVLNTSMQDAMHHVQQSLAQSAAQIRQANPHQ